MDLVTLLTIIGSFIGTIALMLGLFLYLGNKIDSLVNVVYTEMKDFHGRLCALEEKNRK